jgi:hypothetical protein
MQMQSNTLNICIQDRLHPVVHMHRLIDLIDEFSPTGEMFTEVVFPFENPVETCLVVFHHRSSP